MPGQQTDDNPHIGCRVALTRASNCVGAMFLPIGQHIGDEGLSQLVPGSHGPAVSPVIPR